MTVPQKRSTKRLASENRDTAMLNDADVEKEFAAVPLASTNFAPVVGQNRLHRQVERAIRGLHVIGQRRRCALGPPGDVREAGGVGA